jgi:integrase
MSDGGAQIRHDVRSWKCLSCAGTTPGEKDAQRVYKSALRAMRRALEHAGLPAYFGLHSRRHTYGSGLISRGVSPAYVQQQMGHASIQQTVDTYGSRLPVRGSRSCGRSRRRHRASPLRHHMDTLAVLEAVQTL